jgi:hypothetical protein
VWNGRKSLRDTGDLIGRCERVAAVKMVTLVAIFAGASSIEWTVWWTFLMVELHNRTST